MSRRPNIALVGMMASGKTVVGRLMATALGWGFVDTDAEVAAAQRRSIEAIFATDGEEAFREMETEALCRAVARENAVIATGGGAVLRPENRALLTDRCWAAWLRASPEEHARRAAADERRPLLMNETDPAAAVRRLLAARAPFYALADETVDTEGRSPREIADDLLQRWRCAADDVESL